MKRLNASNRMLYTMLIFLGGCVTGIIPIINTAKSSAIPIRTFNRNHPINSTDRQRDSIYSSAEKKFTTIKSRSITIPETKTFSGLHPASVGSEIKVPEGSVINNLKLAIYDMIKTFGDQYVGGSEFIGQLKDTEKEYNEATNNKLKSKAIFNLIELRRKALLMNPLLIEHPILFVVRNQYSKDHHNTHTMFPNDKYEYNGPGGAGPPDDNQFTPGASLKIIDLKNSGKVKTLLDAPEGVIRDPDVYWDGNKIIFSMRQTQADSYHIYEIDIDGTGLKQLTFLKNADDMDPLYLPDNTIVFSSTREPKFIPCNRHASVNIYRMDSDGANIHQITKNTLYDKPSFIMSDGRILYDRWEYIDRDSHNAQSLWTVNPDGTNPCLYWGNNTETPDGVVDARIIPGTQQTISIFASLHDRPRGMLAILDRRLGMDGPEPVLRTWPADGIKLVKGPRNNDDADVIMLKHVSPVYEDPYPLNDKYFLVSRTTNHHPDLSPPGESIYLVDLFGNETLIYHEDPGCFDPMPIAKRERPLIRQSLRNYENKEGYFYVQDVYTGLKNIPRGTVKYLRVVEAPEKRYWASGSLAWFNYTTTYPGISWHSFETKRILGTVPIKEDGSAYFKVPSDRFVYFQLLDEKGMMIQSMRSGTSVQSGEIAGCIGCHDNRNSASSNRQFLMAVSKTAENLQNWYGEERCFNYSVEVQPVFDRYCVKCHDYGTEAGKKIILAGDRNQIFNTSYNELWRKKYVIVTGAGPTQIPEPKSWGSHASLLVQTVINGHQGITLTKEELDRIVTWIDLNAIFYGSFASSYPENRGGHSPLTPKEEDRLGELTGINMASQYSHYGNQGPLISFNRPEISPILSKLQVGSDKFNEALAIIKLGKERYLKNPDSDMLGFKLSGIDLWREEKYQYRHWIEMRNRKAIREGMKIYDTDQPSKEEWLNNRSEFSITVPLKQ